MADNPKQDKIDNLNSLADKYPETNGHHTGVVYVLRSANSAMVDVVYREFGYIPRMMNWDQYKSPVRKNWGNLKEVPLTQKFYFYYWL